MLKELKKLKWFLKERAKDYFIGLLALQTLNILVIIPPLLIGSAIDKISQGILSPKDLFQFLLIMSVLSITNYGLSCIWAYKIFESTLLIDLRIRGMMMKKILRMPQTFFERFSSGDLMNRATGDIDAVGELMGFGVLSLSDSIGYLLTVLLAMGFFVSWKLTLLSILPFPVLTLLTNYVGKYIHKLYTEQQKAFSQMNDEVLEHINGIRVIRSYVLEERACTNFETTVDKLFKKSLKTELLSIAFWPASKIFSTVSFAIALIFGTSMVINKDITLGQLISFNLYLNWLIWPMFAMGEFMNIAHRGSSSIQRIYEVLDSDDDKLTSSQRVKIKEINSIVFHDYSFQYPSSKFLNLKDINLTIKKGKLLGIVGKTGSGKSTLIKQILKQYPKGEGELLISDQSVFDIEKASLMSQIGYVSQDNILFSKSIKENILIGKEDADEEELLYSIKTADFQKDLTQFAEGLDSLVGERGISVSGGQKQRICLARAIIKNPELLILDDSLSAVDSKTEAKIIKNIRVNRKGKTTIIVSHRLSAVSDADEIIVMNNGQIVERGKHNDLIKLQGQYEKQYRIQQMEAKDGT